MFADTFFRRIFFNFALIFAFLSVYILVFMPVYTASSVIINFAVTPFDICEKYPELWGKLKFFFIIISSISSLIIINLMYSTLFTKKIKKHGKKEKKVIRLTSFHKPRKSSANHSSWSKPIPKYFNNWNNRLPGKQVQQCILSQGNL